MYMKTILFLALVLRLGIVGIILSRHPGAWLFRNMPDLAFLAHSLSSGHGLSSPFGGSTGPTAFLAPGYPAIVGLIFRLLGSYSLNSAAAVMLLQTMFAVVTVAVIMHVACRLFGAPTANLAGAFWAVSLPLIWLPVVFWETSLSTLFLVGMTALALRCLDKPGKGLWAIMGSYCALATLVNPSLMPALFASLAWTAYQTRSAWRCKTLLCLLVFLVFLTPWTIRNALVLHAFIPLRINFGYELWQGNRTGATGIFDATLYPLQNKQEYSDYTRSGEVAYMRNKSTIATDHIRAYPGEFIGLSAKRAGLFWIGASEADSKLVELHVAVTSLLGLVGLAVLFRQNQAMALLFLLPLLVYPLPYYITHTDFRFRIVLDPLLTILGAYALIQLNTYLAGIKRRRLTG
jgi:hypothetical protein